MGAIERRTLAVAISNSACKGIRPRRIEHRLLTRRASTSVLVCPFDTATADSGACRPPIPKHAGPPFRTMPATHSEPCRPGFMTRVNHGYRGLFSSRKGDDECRNYTGCAE
jgi:hypothetical protein